MHIAQHTFQFLKSTYPADLPLVFFPASVSTKGGQLTVTHTDTGISRSEGLRVDEATGKIDALTYKDAKSGETTTLEGLSGCVLALGFSAALDIKLGGLGYGFRIIANQLHRSKPRVVAMDCTRL